MITTTVEQIAYERCQASWGGATLCVTTNQFVPDDAIGYVFATGDTIEIHRNPIFRYSVRPLLSSPPTIQMPNTSASFTMTSRGLLT